METLTANKTLNKENIKNNLSKYLSGALEGPQNGPWLYTIQDHRYLISNTGELSTKDIITSKNHKMQDLDREGNYSWSIINTIANKISDNSDIINNETEEVAIEIDGMLYILGIGDTKEVQIQDKNYTTRIVGFNHDELTDSSSYGNENKYAGISFEFTDSIMSQPMNISNGNDGGWGACNVKNNIFTEEFIDTLSNSQYIKEVKKLYTNQISRIENDITKWNYSLGISNDKLWLLSTMEVWGEKKASYFEEGMQYQFYRKNSDDVYKIKNGIKNGDGAYDNMWWLRTAYASTTGYFICLSNGGEWSYTAARLYYNIAPGFSI